MHAASSIDADTVVTDAISGASSVDGALTVLNSNINTMVGTHSTDIVALKNDLGIVENGDTATHTIAQGQYVIWHSALYTADAAITSGTTLAASGNDKNLTAVENGGLNALNDNISALLPAVTSSDNGKVLEVKDGMWNKSENDGRGYDILVEYATASTSHTIQNINQFKTIVVALYWAASSTEHNLLVSHTLSLNMFKFCASYQSNGIQVETHDASRHFVHLYLDSDTSIHFDAGSGMTSNHVVSVYGIK